MKLIILPIALFAISTAVFSQDFPSPAHQSTSSIPGARFEILQSPLAAKWTFRLDRYTGRIWQLVKTTEDDNSWEEMLVLDLPKLQSPTRPRFQLFTSGIAARHTFLLDSDSGKTWYVFSGKGKNKDGSEFDYNAWQLFAQ